ncbi:hypothetical protein D3C73_697820 [compost metagenome]
MQADQALLPGARRRQIACLNRVMQGDHGLGRQVRGDRDHPHAAVSGIAQVAGIIAREQVEGSGDVGSHPAGAGDIARRILDADDVRMGRQRRHRLVGQVHAGAARHVVEQNRQLHGVGHRLEMGLHPCLRRAVVIGRDHQGAVSADRLSEAGQFDGLVGGGRSGARDYADAAGGDLDALFDHALVLVQMQGRALARGAHRHDAVNPGGDLAFQQALESDLVHVSVTKRCDQGGDHALEQGGGHENKIPARRWGGSARLTGKG